VRRGGCAETRRRYRHVEALASRRSEACSEAKRHLRMSADKPAIGADSGVSRPPGKLSASERGYMLIVIENDPGQ